jgi:hypothetical protein
LDAAKEFYGQMLKLEVPETEQGLMLMIAGGNGTFVYPELGHTPATYTMLNFPVDDTDAAVAQLTRRGATFERYAGMTDDDAIAGASRRIVGRTSLGSGTLLATSCPCFSRRSHGVARERSSRT